MTPRDDTRAMPLCGCIRYSEWADYAWKNELNDQRDRVLTHLQEIMCDATIEHDPHHMLERAFGIAAFCMRRLIECRRVTDQFLESKIQIFEISRSSKIAGRNSFVRSTGGNLFHTYDMKTRSQTGRRPNFIADKFLHARYIAILTGSAYLPDGLLVASDRQAEQSLFHIAPTEYRRITQAFLDDHIEFETDWLDIQTGEICASRK